MAVLRIRDESGEERDVLALRGEKGDPGDVSLSYAHNTFANALKGTASGKVVVVNDVSPVEHDIMVIVSGDTDLSKTSIRRYGVNLYNVQATKAEYLYYSKVSIRQFEEGVWYPGLNSENFCCNDDVSSYSISKDGRLTFTTTLYGCGMAQAFRCIPNTTYYFKCNRDNTHGNNHHGVGYYDLNGKWLSNACFNLTESGSCFTTPSNCYWMTIHLIGIVGEPVTYSDISLQLMPITECMPYVEPTSYQVVGNVANLKSLAPGMTLISDNPNVFLEFEYNKDTTKVIGNLLKRVSALEGAVVNNI